MTYKEELFDKIKSNFPGLDLDSLWYDAKMRSLVWDLDPESGYEIHFSLAKAFNDPHSFTLNDGLTLTQPAVKLAEASLWTQTDWSQLGLPELPETRQVTLRNHPLVPLVPKGTLTVQLGYVIGVMDMHGVLLYQLLQHKLFFPLASFSFTKSKWIHQSYLKGVSS